MVSLSGVLEVVVEEFFALAALVKIDVEPFLAVTAKRDKFGVKL